MAPIGSCGSGLDTSTAKLGVFRHALFVAFVFLRSLAHSWRTSRRMPVERKGCFWGSGDKRRRPSPLFCLTRSPQVRLCIASPPASVGWHREYAGHPQRRASQSVRRCIADRVAFHCTPVACRVAERQEGTAAGRQHAELSRGPPFARRAFVCDQGLCCWRTFGCVTSLSTVGLGVTVALLFGCCPDSAMSLSPATHLSRFLGVLLRPAESVKTP